MAGEKHRQFIAPPNVELNPPPISIVVSYEWERGIADGSSKTIKPVRQHTRWNKIKALVNGTLSSVQKRAQRNPGLHQLHIQVRRLRGQHGMALLPNLRKRISGADVMLVDLGSDHGVSNVNSNVLLELGMALYDDKLDQGSLFIFKPKSVKWPSDLDGIFYSEYEPTFVVNKSMKLMDRAGFDAALRSRLLEIARERGMFGGTTRNKVEFEDESADQIRFR